MFIMIDELVNYKVMTMAPKIIDKEAKKYEILTAAIVLTKSYIKGLKK